MDQALQGKTGLSAVRVNCRFKTKYPNYRYFSPRQWHTAFTLRFIGEIRSSLFGAVSSHLPSGFPVIDTGIGRLVLETGTDIATSSRLHMKLVSTPGGNSQ